MGTLSIQPLRPNVISREPAHHLGEHDVHWDCWQKLRRLRKCFPNAIWCLTRAVSFVQPNSRPSTTCWTSWWKRRTTSLIGKDWDLLLDLMRRATICRSHLPPEFNWSAKTRKRSLARRRWEFFEHASCFVVAKKPGKGTICTFPNQLSWPTFKSPWSQAGNLSKFFFFLAEQNFSTLCQGLLVKGGGLLDKWAMFWRWVWRSCSDTSATTNNWKLHEDHHLDDCNILFLHMYAVAKWYKPFQLFLLPSHPLWACRLLDNILPCGLFPSSRQYLNPSHPVCPYLFFSPILLSTLSVSSICPTPPSSSGSLGVRYLG